MGTAHKDIKLYRSLKENLIDLELQGKNKNEVIGELVELLSKSRKIRNKKLFFKAMLEREKLGSTGIGNGVAIPHAKSDYVSKLVAAFGLSKKGIDFDSLDGEAAYIFFLLVAPQDSAGPHLKALARISRLLKDKYFRDGLRACTEEKSIIKIISQEDEKRI